MNKKTYIVAGSGITEQDAELALKVINNSEYFKSSRDKKTGITSRFYSYNHVIYRLDWSCRCSVLEDIRVCN